MKNSKIERHSRRILLALLLVWPGSTFGQALSQRDQPADRFQKYLQRIHGPDYKTKRTVASLDPKSKVDGKTQSPEQHNASLILSQQDILSAAEELNRVHSLKSQLMDCGLVQGYKVSNCGENERINKEILAHQAGVKALVQGIQGRGLSMSTACQGLVKSDAPNSEQDQSHWIRQVCAIGD